MKKGKRDQPEGADYLHELGPASQTLLGHTYKSAEIFEIMKNKLKETIFDWTRTQQVNKTQKNGKERIVITRPYSISEWY